MASLFPTTYTLDDAQRADEDPLSQSGAWTSISGGTSAKIVSNRFATNSDSGISYRSGLSLNDTEVWAEVTSFSGQFYLWPKLYDDGGQSPIRDSAKTGWRVAFNNSTFFVQLYENNSATLVQDNTQWPTGSTDLAVPAWVGARIVGTTLEIWYNDMDGNGWLMADDLTASDASGAGTIALGGQTSFRSRNFGGGEYRESQTAFYSRSRSVSR